MIEINRSLEQFQLMDGDSRHALPGSVQEISTVDQSRCLQQLSEGHYLRPNINLPQVRHRKRDVVVKDLPLSQCCEMSTGF